MLSREDIWFKMWYNLRALGEPEPNLQNLAKAYQSPPRFYHTFDGHITNMAQEFESVTDQFCDGELIQFAIFFHDVVYVPGAVDNEYQSAQLAMNVARNTAKLPKSFAQAIESMILATSHHNPQTYHQRVLVDLDLAIFGKPAKIFNQYETGIRQEYSHVPIDAFRFNRVKVLQSFLDRERIYHFDHFFELYERTARENLSRSIQKLGW